MSHEGFKALLDQHATRADRIAVLSSPTDAVTGLPDNQISCDGAYWQGTGPVGITGQAYAALADIFDVLHGRATTGSLDVLGEMLLSSAGMTLDHNLHVLGSATFDGQVVVNDDMAIVGLLAVAGDLMVGTGHKLVSTDGSLSMIEAISASHLGSIRPIIKVDAADNVMINLFSAAGDYERGNIEGAYGRAMNFGVGDGTYAPLYMSQHGRLFLSKYKAIMELPHMAYATDSTPGLCIVDPIIAMAMVSSGGTSDEATIKHFGKWTGGEANDATSDSSIIFGYNMSTVGPYIKFVLGSVAMATMYNGSAWFTGQAPAYAMKHYVASAINETSYYLLSDPSSASPSNRFVGGPGVIPGLQFGSGQGATKTGKVGFDSYETYAAFRIWLNNSGLSGCNPAVSIGAPLGTVATPFDIFTVLDSPYLAAVMANPRDLYANFTHLQGLFVGRGTGGASLHNAARVWLDDSVGTNPLVLWGVRSEKQYMYVKGGVVYTHPATTLGYAEANNIGTVTLGAHRIPYHETANSFDAANGYAGAMSLVMELPVASFDGSAVMVYSSEDAEARLMIYESGSNSWHFFKSDGVFHP